MARDFVLPPAVVGPSELSRLRRDLEQYEEELQKARLQAKSGKKTASAVAEPGHQVISLAELNGLDLAQATHRQQLVETLDDLLKTAPVITMSFAVDPSSAFMAKITAWFRETIDPHVLVRTGLQPNIAAGFMLRTPSKVYDFSLRNKFNAQRPELLKRLRAPKAQPAAEVAK